MEPNQTTTPLSYDPHSPPWFEDPTVGGRNVPPGYWADKARRCEWPRGHRRARTPGTLLYNLQQLPLEREPTFNTRLRPSLTHSCILPAVSGRTASSQPPTSPSSHSAHQHNTPCPPGATDILCARLHNSWKSTKTRRSTKQNSRKSLQTSPPSPRRSPWAI